MSDIPVQSAAIPEGVMAMTNDSAQVITLVKRDPQHGAVLRLDGEWQPLLDPTSLDGLTFVGVTDEAVDVYDKFLGENRLVTIGHYVPSPGGPFWPDPVVDYTSVPTDEEQESVEDGEEVEELPDEIAEEEAPAESEEEAPLAASVVVNSADDLPLAIAAALRDENLRWYVERRMSALGLEAALPWLKD